MYIGHPDFMYSENLWSVAQKKGWWRPESGHLNFLKTYSPERYIYVDIYMSEYIYISTYTYTYFLNMYIYIYMYNIYVCLYIYRYHPSYVNLRIWRVFTLANPHLNIPSESNPYGDDYPFSVRVGFCLYFKCMNV
jgi:dipeptidase